MSRTMLLSLVAMVGCAGAPGASAAPAAAVAALDAMSASPIQYGPCPPGYKITSHGGCKLSHYLRHHPEQNPNNDYIPPRPRYPDRYDGPRYRDYDDGDGGDGGYDNGDYGGD
jgi:hypothetical protein